MLYEPNAAVLPVLEALPVVLLSITLKNSSCQICQILSIETKNLESVSIIVFSASKLQINLPRYLTKTTVEPGIIHWESANKNISKIDVNSRPKSC